ncbi:2Fe-2S iron-sulfur cluster-binding protein [Algoriphagus sediminis]|uniref:2Fe-2S iron-sulfur cluster-binding protein n=1 Tax=Algoriphagus sediminis TaxID=3057113 RepID=A0ABT7YE93_9BACT|nr:2Fe-2S iron-sulfur cluster-binding protein [Algoriphagus sediminis]MDN3204846.1 2Fe-2S iron-sulfur cluster-binding protein [Algoriphagus sediminis]
MPKVIIENLFELEIETNDADRKVIDLIHENGIDWMHACGKKGRCTTCKMIMVSGEENLSPMNEFEKRFYELGRLKNGERLACQSILKKKQIKMRVAENNKFPHIRYSD